MKLNFNEDWQFRNQENLLPSIDIPTNINFSFEGWQTICLPHTAKIEPLVIKNPWIGISWYKKDFVINPEWTNRKIFIEFEAVMQQAEVWLNGKLLMKHTGGYLPFTIDISKEVSFTKTNRLVVKANNQDNPEVPPGKPIDNLDFCYYSGIYRNVSLVVTGPLYISDPVKENRTASGGLKIWYPLVSKKEAEISVATHIRNEYPGDKTFIIACKLNDKNGKTVATAISDKQTITAGGQISVTTRLNIPDPQLWHPQHPNLYTLKVEVVENGKTVDAVQSHIGIRKFEVKDEKFLINGEPLLLVGTNRHQEYPYIGNALSDNAQYRDAMKIKQAGFNIVRLSHYPQSPAFMDACDKLGLLAIDAIPGWQFVGDDHFMQHSYQDARELIRRDRNHACVAMWELSLNESAMPDQFMENMNRIAKEESPETKLLTCGWINKYYDVFIPARQHAKPPYYWKNYDGKIQLFTAEYGDWEYFAQDAGLNQAGYAGLKADERTSRQLRGNGEKRLLQQATNYQEAHNDNLRNPHLGDANWLMFDYNRGYSPDIESSGIMDIFRLPKFSYYLYRSQSIQPTLKIASYWNEKSDYHNLKVFANCDEVALYLNEKLIERKKAGRNSISDKLPNPPFIFDLKAFTPGTLKAVGYTNNKKVAEDKITTAGSAKLLKISFDLSGKPFKANGADVIFAYVTVCDKKGNQVYESDREVQLETSTGVSIIGPDHVKAEAGIATFLLRSGSRPENIIISAKSQGLLSGKSTIMSTK
ncbi:MAG: glycoside hydrolase family 2 TIM barrel-domain containing protein [Bacteroidota bacterium]|nr:glycoside hydrolase family 2 TIM barrel-domain containing protein [Bacteroidota bacterium]